MISANPNTIYPLLRDLEARGLIEGQWEHPDRRTRRFYSITPAGRKEYRRLVAELEPFLDSVIRSVTLIKREIYGVSGGDVGVAVGRVERLARRGRGTTTSTRRAGPPGSTGSRAWNPSRRLPGGWRDAALELDPGGTRGGRRAGARARAAHAFTGSRSATRERRRAQTPSPSRGRGRVVTQELDYRLREPRPVRMAHRPPVHPLPDARIAAPLARRLALEVRGSNSAGILRYRRASPIAVLGCRRPTSAGCAARFGATAPHLTRLRRIAFAPCSCSRPRCSAPGRWAARSPR